MLCAASVRIGRIPQAFWAVLDRSQRGAARPHGVHPGLVAIGDGHLSVHGRGIDIDLALAPAGEPMEVISPHGGSYIWTRKDPGRARGTVATAADVGHSTRPA